MAAASGTHTIRERLQQGGYTDRDHRALIDSLRETPNSLKASGPFKHGVWANPDGIPTSLAESDRYLADLPRPQAKAIVAVQDKLAKSALGRGLLERAREGGVTYGYSAMRGSIYGKYGTLNRQTVYNSAQKIPADNDEYISVMAYVSAHELTHAQQHAHMGPRFANLPMGIDNVAVRLDDRILLDRHMEAAANATSVQFAFDTMKAGDNSVWRGIAIHNADLHATRDFALTFQADKDAATDGRARRAAHDAHFIDRDYLDVYDRQRVQTYATLLTVLAAQQADGFPDPDARKITETIGSIRLSDDDIAAAAELPDGSNHLTATGANVRDSRYTVPGSLEMSGKTRFLMAIADRFRDGKTVTVETVQSVRLVQSEQDAEQMIDSLSLGDDLDDKLLISNWRKNRATGPDPAAKTPHRPTL
ncbi:MAG: hypothetical protein CL558_01820 [Alphaproteobacteria bacterium]|nr:hypothetical protein [Alphaproteobacteria bacterium]MAS47397.1 hypothetical protein [Alphaproteobacteria bacterium]MAX96730.1 hypothetical protein [Alphaproteobacteria bacterium]MBN52295.1 hypothetical protein [Alphaproteobacteria bacterium]OUT41098.1 MAG: hypothetical protein CBB62_01685 [Micavibrio sp. TMED2]|tara:strand:- start:2904 stop:4163 length:1260 start_codon:yes stop_codon:yes gene_type:complete